MNRPESIAVLKAHKDAISECNTFEAFKIQQIAFLDFMIEEMSMSEARYELLYNWIVRVRTDV